MCENSIFIGQALTITKKLCDKNDDFQLLLLCFVPCLMPWETSILIFLIPVLTQLNSCHQCFLLFNFPLKTGRVVFRKQFIVKNHNSFQSGFSDVSSSENAWISNFFSLHKIYIYKEQVIKLIITFSFSNIHNRCINIWFSFHYISNVIQWGNINKSVEKHQHPETFKIFCCKIVLRSWTSSHFWGWMGKYHNPSHSVLHHIALLAFSSRCCIISSSSLSIMWLLDGTWDTWVPVDICLVQLQYCLAFFVTLIIQISQQPLKWTVLPPLNYK